MSYKKEVLFNQAMDIIKKHKITSIVSLISYMPCQRSTFYEHFPNKSDKSDTLKKEIEKNKVFMKEKLVNIWLDPEKSSPATQIFLYKLCANQEEKEAIYDTSIKAKIETPKHEITLNLIDGKNEALNTVRDKENSILKIV
jgi:hypothetical protein